MQKLFDQEIMSKKMDQTKNLTYIQQKLKHIGMCVSYSIFLIGN